MKPLCIFLLVIISHVNGFCGQDTGKGIEIVINGKIFEVPAPDDAKYDKKTSEDVAKARNQSGSSFNHELTFIKSPSGEEGDIKDFYHLTHAPARMQDYSDFVIGSLRVFDNPELRAKFISKNKADVAGLFRAKINNISLTEVPTNDVSFAYVFHFSGTLNDYEFTCRLAFVFFFFEETFFQLSSIDYHSRTNIEAVGNLLAWKDEMIARNQVAENKPMDNHLAEPYASSTQEWPSPSITQQAKRNDPAVVFFSIAGGFTVVYTGLLLLGMKIRSKKAAFIISIMISAVICIYGQTSSPTPMTFNSLPVLFGFMGMGGIFYVPLAGYKRLTMVICSIFILALSMFWYYAVMK